MSVTVDEFVKARVLPEYRDVVAMLRALMREIATQATVFLIRRGS
jgi:hypothetical protein